LTVNQLSMAILHCIRYRKPYHSLRRFLAAYAVLTRSRREDKRTPMTLLSGELACDEPALLLI
jgi:hypothetical protein